MAKISGIPAPCLPRYSPTTTERIAKNEKRVSPHRRPSFTSEFVLWLLICLSPGLAFAQVDMPAGSADASPVAADGDDDPRPVSEGETVNLRELMQEPLVVPDGRFETASYGLLITYCILVVAASVLGGWLSYKFEFTHTGMQTVISFVGGLMLGIGVFHLLPHAIIEVRNPAQTAQWMMVGILMMFALIRLFHFHNHEPMPSHGHLSESSDAGLQVSQCHDHDHDHDHGSDQNPPAVMAMATTTGEGHSPAECHTQGHAHGFSWLGIALGLSLHTLIDGLALGASVFRESQQATTWSLFGLGTFLAILLHKPLDAVSITSLMVAGGWRRKTIRLVNAGFALMCPLGAFLFLLGLTQFAAYQQELLGSSLAFAAGVFICVALSDLLPEMEFHSHNKVQLTLALAAGLGLAYIVTLLEPSHLH